MTKDPTPIAVGGVSMLAGMIHLMLVSDHLGASIGTGLFFIGIGAAQVAWGALMIRGTDERMQWTGAAAVLIAPTVLYILTRVMRAPWAAGPEHVDALGVLTILLQLGAFVLMLTGPSKESWRGAGTVGVGLLIATGSYAMAIAVEDVDFLAAGAELHAHGAHGHGDEAHGHDEEHADHAGHAHHGPPMPGMRGVSIVGNVTYFGPPDAQAIYDYCTPQGEPMDCWVHFMKDYLEAHGAIPAFDVLENLTHLSRDARELGHTMAHELGHHAYMSYGLNVTLALGECSYKVFQGCLHGALQAYFGDLAAQGQPITAQAMNTLCEASGSKFKLYSCNHGVGHGIMMYTGYALHDSLDLCRLLDSGFTETACYGGIFMENVHGYFDSLDPDYVPHDHGNGPPTYWVDRDDPAYPCNVVDKEYVNACWVQQTSLVLHLNKVDFAEASEVCDEAGAGRISCYKGLGRLARPYADGDPATMSQYCSYGEQDGRTACVRAFVAGAISDANDPDAGRDLCPKLAVNLQEACHEEVGEQAGYMMGQEVMAYCESGPAEFVDACQRGVRL